MRWRKIVRITLLFALSLFVVSLLLLGTTQTAFFRNWLRDIFVDLASENLHADVYIGRFEGSIFTGLTIDSLSVERKGVPVFTASSITVRYDPFQLPNKYLRLSEITFVRPAVYLLRGKDGVWNVDSLFAAADSTEEAGAFDWTFDLDAVRILDGTLIVYDSVIERGSGSSYFNTSNLSLEGITLTARALVSADLVTLALNGFSVMSTDRKFVCTNIVGDVEITPRAVKLTNLGVNTSRSRFVVTAEMEGVGIEGFPSKDSLAHAPLRVRLGAPLLSSIDLQYFIPSLDFLGSRYQVELDAKGSLKQLAVSNLYLETPGTIIDFKGTLRDILKGGEMWIDLVSTETRIDARELPDIIPGIALPDFSPLGVITIDTLRYQGQPLDFHAAVSTTSNAGMIEADLRLNLREKHLIYDGKINTRGLNLAHVFGDPSFSSYLNIMVDIEGSGTEMGRIYAAGEVFIDSSRYNRQVIQQVRTTFLSQGDRVDLDIRARHGVGTASAKGSLVVQEGAVSSFNFVSRFDRVNLGKWLGRDSLDTDLNVSLAANGTGFDLETSSLAFRFVLDTSVIRGYPVSPDTAEFNIDQRNPGRKSLFLRTRYVEASMTGAFSIPRLVEFFSASADTIARDAGRLVAFKAVSAPADTGNAGDLDTSGSMDAVYSVTFKHSIDLPVFFGSQPLIIRGNVKGRVRGGSDSASVTARLVLPEFYYVDSLNLYVLEDLDLNCELDGVSPRTGLKGIRANVRGRAGVIYTDDMQLERVNVDLRLEDLLSRVRFRGLLPDGVFVEGAATGKLDGRVDVGFDRLQVSYRNKRFSAVEPFTVIIDSEAVSVNGLAVKSGDGTIEVDGVRTFDGRNDFNVYGTRFQLADIDDVLAQNEEEGQDRGFHGWLDINGNVTGTDSEPVIALEVHIDSLNVANVDMGNLELELTYNNRQVQVFGDLNYGQIGSSRSRVMFVSGFIPMRLSFAGDTAPLRDDRMNVRLQMKELPLELVEGFIGIFSNLTGTANADITISGSTQHPQYAGELRIDNGDGILDINRMRYLIKLAVAPSRDKIVIKELELRNDPNVWEKGVMRATGEMGFADLALGDFSFHLNGQLKILDRYSRHSFKSLYGQLYVATGPGGLNYKGRFAHSILYGDLVALEGKLRMPTEQGTSELRTDNDIVYTLVDDTTRRKESSLSKGRRLARIRRLGEPATIVESRRRGRSLVDGLNYNLTFSTLTPIRLTMPFSTLQQEELSAQLTVDKLVVSNWGGKAKFEGEVELAGNSYYLFLGKQFKTSGKLRFIGDPTNPELDLTAVYSVYHTRYHPGQTNSNGETRRLYVILRITGDRNKPHPSWDLRWDAEDGAQVEPALNTESNAISVIITGRFTDELTSRDKSNLLQSAGDLTNTVLSSMLSTAMSEFLGKTGLRDIVQRVEFSNLGGEESRIKLTSEIGKAVLTFDGKINNLGSGDIIIELPLNQMFGWFPIGNMILELSRRVTTNTIEGATTTGQAENLTYEAKLLYRISF